MDLQDAADNVILNQLIRVLDQQQTQSNYEHQSIPNIPDLIGMGGYDLVQMCVVGAVGGDVVVDCQCWGLDECGVEHGGVGGCKFEGEVEIGEERAEDVEEQVAAGPADLSLPIVRIQTRLESNFD